MKLVQFFLPGKGLRVGLVRNDLVLDITATDEAVTSTLDLVRTGKTTAGTVARAEWLGRRLRRKSVPYRDLYRTPSRRAAHLLLPILPPEIWTLVPQRPTALLGDPAQRPQYFFKGTAARAVGPEARARLRADATDTVAYPALAGILGDQNEVVAFSIATDLTARDVASRGPGFLAQATVYGGSCALGPCLVTADEFRERATFQMRYRILRQGAEACVAAFGLSDGCARIQQAAPWLRADDGIRAGTVLLAPIEIGVPSTQGVRDGDRVEVEMEGIGRLAHGVKHGLRVRD